MRKIKLLFQLWQNDMSIGYMNQSGIKVSELERQFLVNVKFFLEPGNPINNEYFIERFRNKMLTI